VFEFGGGGKAFEAIDEPDLGVPPPILWFWFWLCWATWASNAAAAPPPPPALPIEGDRNWSLPAEGAGGKGEEAADAGAGVPFERREEGKDEGTGDGLAAQGCCEFYI